jgi:UrcA family protein
MPFSRIYTHVDHRYGRVVMSLMNRKRGTLTGLAMLCTAAFLSTGAVAATETQESVHVSYVAADLTQPDAAEALYLHIRRAARAVCHEPDIRELENYRLYQRCYARAVDNAVAKVDATALTALHRSKIQRSAAG